jgi:hypothetical protein
MRRWNSWQDLRVVEVVDKKAVRERIQNKVRRISKIRFFVAKKEKRRHIKNRKSQCLANPNILFMPIRGLNAADCHNPRHTFERGASRD